MEGPTTGLVIGDAFHIDDLLDFSNEDIAGPIGESLLSSLDSNVTEVTDAENAGATTGSLAGTKHLLEQNDDHPPDVLCVPCDDIAELEWLSQFVEASEFSMSETPSRPMNSDGLSVNCMDLETPYHENHRKDPFYNANSPRSVLEESCGSSGTAGGFNDKNNINSSTLVYRETFGQGRARSKRARTGGRVWCNSRILTTPELSNAEAAAAGAATDTESLSSDSNVITGDSGPGVIDEDSLDRFQKQLMMMMTPPPKAVTTLKKPWKASSAVKKTGSNQHPQHSLDGGAAAPQTWRCLHCATQRTPQWRAGPMGPKTLCNACGVRYKSGRLLPEYRPAGSPGYVGHKHSNSHKKILEMRRQRETTQQQHHQKLSMFNSLSSSCHSSSPAPVLSPSSILADIDDDPGMCISQS